VQYAVGETGFSIDVLGEQQRYLFERLAGGCWFREEAVLKNRVERLQTRVGPGGASAGSALQRPLRGF
jgi:hypothetical protein